MHAEEMILCTDTNCIQKDSNEFVLNHHSLTKDLILPATTNKSMGTKFHKTLSFISAASTKKPD